MNIWIGNFSNFFSNLLLEPTVQAFLKSPPRPRGYWTMDGNKNVRKFLDDLAWSKNLDPLIPETWYSIPLRELRFQRRGKVCLFFFCFLFLFFLFFFCFCCFFYVPTSSWMIWPAANPEPLNPKAWCSIPLCELRFQRRGKCYTPLFLYFFYFYLCIFYYIKKLHF
jgi:hypothetical protein